ncbi:hypothetical protein H6F74_18150 [Trichocoleus sp. FACHB-90]|nr:hypothetical protein [Trichocoleus sp. FACHB-90]
MITIGYQVGDSVGCHTIETSKQPLTNAGIAVSDKTHYPRTATMQAIASGGSSTSSICLL